MTFGAYSLALGIAAANGVLLSLLLLHSSGRHRGSPWLAALTAGLALRLLPYILGFAGAYDLHPALTFAPFDTTLAWGPLLWVYVVVLSTGALPERWRWHVVPFLVQLLYQCVAFALPPAMKWDWYGGAHLQVIEPVGAVLVLASLGLYGFAAWRQYERWQAWLDANLSNREESRLGWLRLILAGFGVTGGIGVLLMVVHLAITPLDYFARMPVVAALALLAYLIALLGYRFGGQAIAMTAVAAASAPAAVADAPEPPEAAPAAPDLAAGTARAATKDYAGEAAAWRTRVRTAGWHRDPALTATRLAELLQVSTRSLSRTLNEGLGESFNDFINRIRVEEAVAILARPGAPDVLRVAFDVGFASKASFNRAFRRHAGATPTAIRDGQPSPASQLPPT
ncbi:MAG: AraC family transcriptional regulator [Gemmatimonadaceae bacterium]|nr:AraC family transcriptional regulator [Gemmatimonadaceae bacterium]